MTQICPKGRIPSIYRLVLAFLALQQQQQHSADSAKILVLISGYASPSHRISIEPLAYKLADRGHDLTILSPFEEPLRPHPRIKGFCPPELREFHNHERTKFGIHGFQARASRSGTVDFAATLLETMVSMCEVTLRSKELQDWLKREDYFDLIIFDKTSICDCFYSLAYKLRAKSVGYYSIGSPTPWDLFHFGISAEMSSVPVFELQYSGAKMTMTDRLWNHFLYYKWFLGHKYKALPALDSAARNSLNAPDMPPLLDIIKNESVVFVNSHPSDSFVRSLPAFMIPVGGMHLPQVGEEKKPRKALPKEIQEFIDGAGERGFIYISFGTVNRPSSMPPRLLQAFFDALKSTRFRFLWKWEDSVPEGVPSNVKMLPWFPQKDLLAHSRIRAFITQGGQISIQEAGFFEVPLIIVPVNGDQDLNAKWVRVAGHGIELELAELSASKLALAIMEITENSSYKEAARKLSKASKDRPMHPLDTAVWWTEYVLRQDQKVLKLLRPLAADQPWWEHTGLDLLLGILIFVIAWTVVATLLLLLFIRHCIRQWTVKKQEKFKAL